MKVKAGPQSITAHQEKKCLLYLPDSEWTSRGGLLGAPESCFFFLWLTSSFTSSLVSFRWGGRRFKQDAYLLFYGAVIQHNTKVRCVLPVAFSHLLLQFPIICWSTVFFSSSRHSVHYSSCRGRKKNPDTSRRRTPPVTSRLSQKRRRGEGCARTSVTPVVFTQPLSSKKEKYLLAWREERSGAENVP